MRGWALVSILLLLLIVLAAIGWVLFTQFRARRSGLPPPSWRCYVPFVRAGAPGVSLPSPRRSNIIIWIKDQINQMWRRRNRTAAGRYEEAGGYTRGGQPSAYGGPGRVELRDRYGRGVDLDEAWDDRVGNEVDPDGAPAGAGGCMDEHELGLVPSSARQDDPYASHQDAAMLEYGGGIHSRGRSKSRNDLGMSGGEQGSDASDQNPFSDAHRAPSLGAASVGRPMVDSNLQQGVNHEAAGTSHDDNSPTERRSVFRESL